MRSEAVVGMADVLEGRCLQIVLPCLFNLDPFGLKQKSKGTHSLTTCLTVCDHESLLKPLVGGFVAMDKR